MPSYVIDPFNHLTSVSLQKNFATARKGEFEHKHTVQAMTHFSILTLRSGQISRGIHICLLQPQLQEEHGLFSAEQSGNRFA